MTLATHVTRDLHVSASRRACIRHVLDKLQPASRYSHGHREARHALLKAALAAHEDHKALVARWRL